ncbi:cytochrome c554/c'-like protein [Geothermobacter ehrlichii]|uniref:Cytochrome c554/c'-like protein n=1 Tax=Geothermobacter ehrlichii TaxID=213224 RepID=A0A5D3WJ94_9BACT|nr:multiheme c-type cytochrome [Geothermobacter ehrlichii]TYO98590.1 cytochrome c554/c'-like protein [Geothermobacter ehrlichii]
MSRKLIVLFVATLLVAPLWGCGSNRDSSGSATTATSDEAIVRATAYVGSDRCGGCHATKHDGWLATAHTKKLRDGSLEVNYINDVDNSGRADFFDAVPLDLSTTANFAKFGAKAPILGSDQGGPYVEIDGTKYYIRYTLGGSPNINATDGDTNSDGLILNDEAQWKQRYIVQIGKSHYILPIQYNAQTGEYVTYDESKWYADDGAGGYVVTPPDKNDSYESRCAGCHVTGLTVALDGDEWTMSFVDSTVACEACHGPGGRHATSPTKDNIVNPATMTTDQDLNGDGVVDQIDNLYVRNYVCYQCHSRGSGKYTAGGTTLAYPSRAGANGEALMYLPGLDWKDYYDVTDDASKYWGGAPGTADFVASKSHHQQQQDFDYGPHAADKSYDHECFVCHDMHDASNKSMVVTELVEDGITVPIDTSNQTNPNDSSKLCLTCHAGFGDFAALTVAQVRNDPTAVTNAVIDHANEMAVMGHSDANCTDCHMPKTAKSAINVTDSAGNVISGDIAGHSLRIVWPSQSVQYPGLPNSCSNCHNADTIATGSNPVPGTDQILAWAKSGHGDETSDAWKHYDWDEGDVTTTPGSRQACQRCHTATGAMNYLSDPANYDPAENEFFLGLGKNQVLYCYGCHDGNDTNVHTPGAIVADYKDATGSSVVFPDLGNSNVCVACHAGRSNGQYIKDNFTTLSQQNFGSANSHYLAAAGILYKTIGYEYAGADYANVGFEHDEIGITAPNTGTGGPCAGCHMYDTGAGANHRFTPFAIDANGDPIDDTPAAVCTACHNGVDEEAWTQATFAAQADGYAAAIAALTAELEKKGIYYNAAAYPYFYNTSDPASQTFANAYASWPDADTLGAAFNLNLLNREPGAFAHNHLYAQRLIFDSIDFLDNGVLDGTIDLSAYPVAAEWYQEDGGNTADDNAVIRP